MKNDIINVNDFNCKWWVEKDIDFYLTHCPAYHGCDGSPRFKTRRDANAVLRIVHTSETPIITYADIEKIAKDLDIYIIGS